jgi:hypothetical protein
VEKIQLAVEVVELEGLFGLMGKLLKDGVTLMQMELLVAQIHVVTTPVIEVAVGVVEK